jgi:hypothetical protein
MNVSQIFGYRSVSGEADRATRRRPIIVANPPGDAEFLEVIDRFLASGGALPGDLEAVLRTRYPTAVVRRRELSAERFDVWYVYRDGHWIRSSGDAEVE